MTDKIQVVHARPDHVDEIAPMFDAYRCWYGKESDLDGARYFISQRLALNEAEIFFVRQGSTAVGFTQLYPMFSSVSMGRVWILNDLFIDESARRQGVGTILLETAAEFARALGAIRLQLETKPDNAAAQSAYEALGWKQVTEYLNYSLELTESVS